MGTGRVAGTLHASRRRRYVWGLAIIAIAGALFFALRPTSATKRARATRVADALPQPAIRESQRASSELQRPDEPVNSRPDGGARTDPNRPIIKHAHVQKAEVCRGEENFVEVEAESQNGTNAFLTTTVIHPRTGAFLRGGSHIPLHLDAPSNQELKVIVEGKNSAETITLPAVKVKDCDAPLQVVVKHFHTTEAPERLRFSAELREFPEPLEHARVTSYEWDFGDGHQLTTSVPSAEHSYEDRDQGVAESSFVVSVTVKSSRDDARGSHLISFPNLGFVHLVFDNEVALSVGVAPPGPEKGAAEKIWLYHGYSKPVHIKQATLREVQIDPKAHTERETFKREYAPEVLLGFSEIKPKESQTARDLSGLQPTLDGFVRYVTLSGVTDDGKTAVGIFSLLPPAQAKNSGEQP
jgi:hypothetical protein